MIDTVHMHRETVCMTDMPWMGLVIEVTSVMPAVDGWIAHAKFHAESDDRGYPTGDFDWQRFYDALAVYKFRPCCGAPQYVVEHRVAEQFSSEWWDAYREAFLEYVANQRDLAVEAA